MKVYRLEPINLDDPSWQKSSVKQIVWVNAESENDARGKVTGATDMGVAVRGPFPKLRSPWDLPNITRCVPDDSRRVPFDKIITSDGEEIPG